MELKINSKETDINATHFIGEFECSYDYLVSMLGMPLEGDGYKTDAEWTLELNGVVATIYNWKNGENYLGSEGTPVRQIRTWHIGGQSQEALTLVKSALKLESL